MPISNRMVISDHLYCRPEVVGRSVGAALYEAIEGEAHRAGIEETYVEASEARGGC